MPAIERAGFVDVQGATLGLPFQSTWSVGPHCAETESPFVTKRNYLNTFAIMGDEVTHVIFADLVNLRRITGVLRYGDITGNGDITCVKYMMVSKKQKAGAGAASLVAVTPGDTMRQRMSDDLLIGRLPRPHRDEKLTVLRSR